jgi:hypothetical protein
MHLQPNWHEVLLWLWYFVGAFFYWLKRAYYGINPPNPVANGYIHYIQRSFVPLLIRFAAGSAFFWALFTPGAADHALAGLGWTNWAWALSMVTQFAVFAAMFGFTVDGALDILISKTPGINTLLPQMPGPLPVPPVPPAAPPGGGD